MATPLRAAVDSPPSVPESTDDDDGDATLVEAVRSGDRDAFAALYDRHAPHVFTLARRVLRCDADAEAVVSDVFLAFWRDPSRFDTSRGSCRTYLVVMARSRAIDRLRSLATRAARTDEAAAKKDGDERQRESAQRPESRVIQSETNRLLRDAVEQLDPKQRQPLELAYFEGLTHREIAARLDEPLGTVKTRIRAALESLRSALRAKGRDTNALP